MNIRYHDFDQTGDGVRRIVEHRAQLLESRLADVEDDRKLLDVTVLYDLHRDMFTANLQLQIGDCQIVAKGGGVQRTMAVVDAFRNLADQLDDYLAEHSDRPPPPLLSSLPVSE